MGEIKHTVFITQRTIRGDFGPTWQTDNLGPGGDYETVAEPDPPAEPEVEPDKPTTEFEVSPDGTILPVSRPYAFVQLDMEGNRTFYVVKDGQISPWNGSTWRYEGAEVSNLRGKTREFWESKYNLYNTGYSGLASRRGRKKTDKDFLKWISSQYPEITEDYLQKNPKVSELLHALYQDEQGKFNDWLDINDFDDCLSREELRSRFDLQTSQAFRDYLEKLQGTGISDKDAASQFYSKIGEHEAGADQILDSEIEQNKDFIKFKNDYDPILFQKILHNQKPQVPVDSDAPDINHDINEFLILGFLSRP